MAEVMTHRSSFIEATSYDRDTSELQITFSNGRTFSYPNVPILTYHAFITSGSKGKFFHSRIKDSFDAEEV